MGKLFDVKVVQVLILDQLQDDSLYKLSDYSIVVFKSDKGLFGVFLCLLMIEFYS